MADDVRFRDPELERLRAMVTPPRRSIVELVATGVLDAELAALAWLLVEARMPLIVGGLERGIGKTTLLEALLDLLPATARRVDLAGDSEDFAWLPEASALGWQAPEDQPALPSPTIPVTPATGYLVAAEMSRHLPIYTSGRAARTLIRAASLGYGIGATLHADRLEDVHDTLRSGPFGVTDDELSYLGLILILRAERQRGGAVRPRIVAAHYARPVGRDEHGHVQRLPPAVLAVRDDVTGQLDHFGWGVMPELGIRLGQKAGDLERDVEERASILRRLVDDGVIGVAHVQRALADLHPAQHRLH